MNQTEPRNGNMWVRSLRSSPPTHNHTAGEKYLSWGIAVLISNEFVCIQAVTKKVYFLPPEFVKILNRYPKKWCKIMNIWHRTCMTNWSWYWIIAPARRSSAPHRHENYGSSFKNEFRNNFDGRQFQIEWCLCAAAGTENTQLSAAPIRKYLWRGAKSNSPKNLEHELINRYYKNVALQNKI